MNRIAPASHENNFDFLRLKLAVWVIISHSYPLVTGSHDTDPFRALGGGQFGLGGTAVRGFFLISGYLITKSWLRKPQLVDYLKRRAFRIVPGFLMAMFFCFAVVVPLSTSSWASSYSMRSLLIFAFNLATLGSYHDGYCFIDNPFPKTVNGSLWTIRWEFICYLGVPLAWRLGMLQRGAVLAAATIAMLAYAKFQNDSVCNLFAQFMAGALFLHYENSIPWRGPKAIGLAVLCVIGLAAAARLGGFQLLFPALGGYLLFWFAFQSRIPLQHFAKYGDFSYGTYLYAFPIQQLLVKYGPPLSPESHALTASLISIAAGAASWYLVEKRFLKSRSAIPASPLPAGD